MWFDGIRQPNTLYVANTSRGKDSTAMLRAIQLMGWPLDMICSVDVWATDTIPAELPPMVAFKDEYDKKVLDWFGIPVTRLCATKRERERERKTESVIHNCRMKDCSTIGCSPKSTDGTSKDSPTQTTVGANCSKTNLMGDIRSKLTYEDIFYRKVSPKREREREREHCSAAETRTETSKSTDSRCGSATGARLSNYQDSRIPESGLPLVYRRTQECRIYGFPYQKGAWCQDRLKGGLLDNPLQPAPARGAEDKYRALHRHCGGRAKAHRQAYAEEGQGLAACANRVG